MSGLLLQGSWLSRCPVLDLENYSFLRSDVDVALSWNRTVSCRAMSRRLRSHHPKRWRITCRSEDTQLVQVKPINCSRSRESAGRPTSIRPMQMASSMGFPNCQVGRPTNAVFHCIQGCSICSTVLSVLLFYRFCCSIRFAVLAVPLFYLFQGCCESVTVF